MKTKKKEYTTTDYILLFFKKVSKITLRKFKKLFSSINFLNLLIVTSIVLCGGLIVTLLAFLKLVIMFS